MAAITLLHLRFEIILIKDVDQFEYRQDLYCWRQLNKLKLGTKNSKLTSNNRMVKIITDETQGL